jgi:hypothetical protein
MERHHRFVVFWAGCQELIITGHFDHVRDSLARALDLSQFAAFDCAIQLNAELV